MEAKVNELVKRVRLTDEGYIYDADCGQEICCDVLPKYLSGQSLEDCYSEVSRVVQTFVNERLKAQLNKVLNDSDLALIDREKELPQVSEIAREDRKWAAAFLSGEKELLKAGYLPVIPLAEAIKEANHEID